LTYPTGSVVLSSTQQLTLPPPAAAAAPAAPSDSQQQQQKQKQGAPPLYRTMRLLPLSSRGVCVLNAALPAQWGEALQQGNPPGSYWFFEVMLEVSIWATPYLYHHKKPAVHARLDTCRSAG
jgi:hypothetical protein